jgi:hypothetical protein
MHILKVNMMNPSLKALPLKTFPKTFRILQVLAGILLAKAECSTESSKSFMGS